MDYTQLTKDGVQHALGAIGVESIEELFTTIPPELRLSGYLDLPEGLSETELLADVTALAAKNRRCDGITCFLGAGAYDHFIPTVVDAMAGQTEFLTAYTPYQAEASQGILQLFYEFQTMICSLTGMEVANASLYEGASAAAEAMMMASAITRRSKVIVAESVHSETLQVLHTYARSSDVKIERAPAAEGVVDEQALGTMVDESTAAVIVQSPNFFGCVERLDRIIPVVHGSGALAVVSMDPLSSGVLKPPGAFGADIVVGEAQSLGVPLQYGGPYLGILATREKYLRKMPGRVVGVARDAEGRRGFCLALQTREQHIKRDRATSNICTNQGLIAARAAVYMAVVGKRGIAQVASQCFDKAHYAADRITALEGYGLRFSAPFFKEFVVQTSRGVEGVLSTCRERGIAAGVPLGRFDKDLDDCFMVAVTEKRTKRQIDELVAALDSV